MKIQPRESHLIVVPMEAPTMMGGLHLPESRREQMMQRPLGKVIAVGPKVNLPEDGYENEAIEVDDVVAYWPKMAGYVYGLDGKVYVYMEAGAVIGRVLSDEQATKDDIEKIEKRHKALMDEQREQLNARVAAANLVDTAGLPMPRLVE